MHAWPLPRVLAHRCGGQLAPENTLAGLDAAAACACRGVEFDVMLSADGQAVLIHDETLDRTTNGRGPVAETALAQLRLLDAGSWFSSRFAGEGLPTLDAALDRCVALELAVN
ncbi:MAG: glycerophosphodiester phosphodiesterase, partial [Betaproteobacteria bacterium HGW-Betaproteobacteria-19]